ncbi:HPr family phosphocarrier protein [Paenibacillus thalictri]|uniref:Phosphocarrier protein HPr n=1 Tax=Paenibacillus thalictri TaxID=2527873 RepID=A0A4Q9DUA2_9BACL|nr:HPr family phosphocarrier protein [Paenibacillus thalictri]TBL79926.1 HPr family phosphocarrier protein [Paenibacillus thalictri]
MRVHDITVPKHLNSLDLQELSRHASKFSSNVTIRYDQENSHQVEVDVKSLLGMLLMPIEEGTHITIVTKGSDEKEAIDSICDFFIN